MNSTSVGLSATHQCEPFHSLSGGIATTLSLHNQSIHGFNSSPVCSFSGNGVGVHSQPLRSFPLVHQVLPFSIILFRSFPKIIMQFSITLLIPQVDRSSLISSAQDPVPAPPRTAPPSRQSCPARSAATLPRSAARCGSAPARWAARWARRSRRDALGPSAG